MRKNRLQWLVKNCALCMKKILAPLIIFLLASLALQAQCADGEHGRIRAMSSFRIMGEFDLWTGADASAPAAYRTLNHEGGMKVTVLDIFRRDTQNGKDGVWLSVLLTAPMWVSGGEWLEKYRRFLVFLPDDLPICDFEE